MLLCSAIRPCIPRFVTVPIAETSHFVLKNDEKEIREGKNGAEEEGKRDFVSRVAGIKVGEGEQENPEICLTRPTMQQQRRILGTNAGRKGEGEGGRKRAGRQKKRQTFVKVRAIGGREKLKKWKEGDPRRTVDDHRCFWSNGL